MLGLRCRSDRLGRVGADKLVVGKLGVGVGVGKSGVDTADMGKSSMGKVGVVGKPGMGRVGVDMGKVGADKEAVAKAGTEGEHRVCANALRKKAFWVRY